MYGDDYPRLPSESDPPTRYLPDLGAQAQERALTWQEALFGRGGGGGGPGGDDRGSTWLGQKFREWACHLIKKEQNNLQISEPVELATYAAVDERKKELAREFNRLNRQPGFDVTLQAIGTVARYNFGLSIPSLQKG